MRLQDKPSQERQDCDPVRPYRKAGLKSSLLPRALHQPSRISHLTCMSLEAAGGIEPPYGALQAPA
jgi:hypothetical protein